MTYHISEIDIVEIRTERATLSVKVSERCKVTLESSSGCIELYLTEEQVEAIWEGFQTDIKDMYDQ